MGGKTAGFPRVGAITGFLSAVSRRFLHTVGSGLFVYLVRVALKMRVWMTGVIADIALWVVAQGILAPFIGRSFMMGFGPYTQYLFIGHVGMTLVMAYLLESFLRRCQADRA